MNTLPTDKPKMKIEKSNFFKSLDIEYTQKMEAKMKDIKDQVQNMSTNVDNFKNHKLPYARIKKIMKLDDDVKMIAGESPILFSKACELFIVELAYKSWVHTLENNRRTLQKCDIANAISRTDQYDFLLDIVAESYKNKLLYCAHSFANNSNINVMSNLIQGSNGCNINDITNFTGNINQIDNISNVQNINNNDVKNNISNKEKSNIEGNVIVNNKSNLFNLEKP